MWPRSLRCGSLAPMPLLSAALYATVEPLVYATVEQPVASWDDGPPGRPRALRQADDLR